MGLTAAQKGSLAQALDLGQDTFVFPEKAGRDLAGKRYIPAHVAVSKANAIFEFDWTSEVIDHALAFEEQIEVEKTNREKTKTWTEKVWNVAYRCRVRVTAAGITHDGIGCNAAEGHKSRGMAHEAAAKAAESDALKRALRKFGQQFGNDLADPDDPAGRDFAERANGTNATPTGYPAPQDPPARPAESEAPRTSAPATTSAPAANTDGGAGDGLGPYDDTRAPNGLTAEGVIHQIKDFMARNNGRRPRVVTDRKLSADKLQSLTSAQLAEVWRAIEAEDTTTARQAA